jgi:hypothetical protein
MHEKSKIDSAAEKLLTILEEQARNLPPSERNAKWLAFKDTVAKIDKRAQRRQTLPL